MNEQIDIGKDPDHPFTVQQLSERVANAVKGWGNAWVEGEIIKFQAKAGGHAYPQLRDLAKMVIESLFQETWTTT